MTARNVVKKLASKHPALNAPVRVASTGRHYIWPMLSKWLRWIHQSRENANFTYDLTERCKINMAATVASILNKEYAEIRGYFDEIENDELFHQHLKQLWLSHPLRYRTDPLAKAGRRIVWYAIARAIKPATIVETGVDQGMGAVVLCAALRRNTRDGYRGKYYGTDINPQAGYYLQGEYAEYGSILYGDSIDSLNRLGETIDLFINDSDHSADYEAAEYETVKSRISDGAILLGDNSHVTAKLAEFSIREKRKFVFLSEEPAEHWYRGAGVGISYPSSSK
jgi:hypothetical protein